MGDTNYEGRILRLEDSINSIVQSVAGMATQQEYIQKRLDEIPDEVSSQLTEISNVLQRNLERITSSQEELSSKLERTDSRNLKYEGRLAALEKEQATRTKRTNFYKRIFAAVIMAAGGALGTQIVEWFTHGGKP